MDSLDDIYHDVIEDLRRRLDKAQLSVINVDRPALDPAQLKENDEAIAFLAELRATLEAIALQPGEPVRREDLTGLLSVVKNYIHAADRWLGIGD